MANHQQPSHPAGAGTFQTSSLQTGHLSQNCPHTLHFYAPTLSIASVNFSKQLMSLCKRYAIGSRMADMFVFSIQPCCWWQFRLQVLGPGPFSGQYTAEKTLSFRSNFSYESFCLIANLQLAHFRKVVTLPKLCHTLRCHRTGSVIFQPNH